VDCPGIFHDFKRFLFFQEAPTEVQTNNTQVEEIKADDNIEISHNDNEDSLNLTIGEEEEQLLRDEEDVKPKGESKRLPFLWWQANKSQFSFH
jgi:hypothetical protein